MNDIIDMNVPDAAAANGRVEACDMELEAVIDVAREMRKAEAARTQAIQRADQAHKLLIQLGGEARGILRMAHGPENMDDAIKANWRGLQTRLLEEMK